MSSFKSKEVVPGVVAPQPRPIDVILRPVHAFSQHRISGAGLLVGAALIAIGLANSPAAPAWAHLLHWDVGLNIGEWSFSKSLTHWVNDGLMAIFFFHVGLEVKRETTMGELANLRKAALPSFAAAGGMIVPALLYYAFNAGTTAAQGWGIPMATDIAFALGVLALLGDRVPVGLRVFLTALAIVDDIGAVIVIALFYTDGIAIGSLVIALILFGVSILLNRLGTRSRLAYFVVGFGVWLAFLDSGVHATVAALLMAFTIPGRTRIDTQRVYDNLEMQLRELEIAGPERDSLDPALQQGVLDSMLNTIEHGGGPLQRLEHQMAPWVTFLVLPVFALVNAGVEISSGAFQLFSEPVALGVFAGLVLGKQAGVLGFIWVALKLGWAHLPKNVRLSHIYGAGLLSGIGFTMSLFISELAFQGGEHGASAKLAILVSSVLSAVWGVLWLRQVAPVSSQTPYG